MTGKTSNSDNFTEFCETHAHPKDIFCRTCEVIVCRKCWSSVHSNKSDHEIIPFAEYKRERIRDELNNFPEMIDEAKINSLRNLFEDATREFIQLDDKLQEMRDQTRLSATLQKEVFGSSSENHLEVNLEELKLSLESQNRYVEEFYARIESLKASLGRAQAYVMEGNTRTFASPSINSESARMFSSCSSDEDEPNQQLSKSANDIAMGVRLCSLAVKTSSPVKIAGSKPLQRAVIDATNTIFCLSWFGVIYTLKTVEAGFISKNFCLKKEFKSNSYWSENTEGSDLRDIAVSSNTLYGAIMKKFVCSVVVLNKHSFHVMRAVNTQAIPQDGGPNGWKLAGNTRILIIRPCASDTLYIYEYERFKETVKLTLENPTNWFSMMFSGDYLMLQNVVDKQLLCIKWSEQTQTSKSRIFKSKTYLNYQPILKSIEDSDSPVLVVKIDNWEYSISRCLSSQERLLRFHDFRNLLNSMPNEMQSGHNMRPFNNDVLGQYDAGKLGLTMLCLVNKNTVLCEEKFEGNEDYSLYLLCVKSSSSMDRNDRESFSRSTTQISGNY
ncbi:uncharacterized protein LOC142341605 [Convolutriloba macropyga]|uniref:uncharacterized protein LOC142341605 n=1 Tax=Convolutriloba macropyga TaxID=536237 RepID=UPI003F51E443